MTKKTKEKVIYLVTDAVKKSPLINLHSLPTKCPVCHSFQEPEPISFQYNENDDAKILLRCVGKDCTASFYALYIKGSYGKAQYHFICFI